MAMTPEVQAGKASGIVSNLNNSTEQTAEWRGNLGDGRKYLQTMYLMKDNMQNM